MDDKLFRQMLSEVADWKIPETLQETTTNAKKKRGRKSNEELYQEAREQIFQEEFDGINTTIPPLLLRIKSNPCVCDDCGAHCPEGRKKEKKLYETGARKKRNWREKCITCNKAQNPFTGKFDLTPTEASHVWTDFLRQSKTTFNPDLKDIDK